MRACIHTVGGHGGSDADEDEEEGEDELAEDAPQEVRLRRLAAVPQRQLPHLSYYYYRSIHKEIYTSKAMDR